MVVTRGATAGACDGPGDRGRWLDRIHGAMPCQSTGGAGAVDWQGRDDLFNHFVIFIVFVLVSYCTVAANFLQAIKITVDSKVWFYTFSVFTIALVLLGFIDYNFYSKAQCPQLNRYKVGVDGGRRLVGVSGGHEPGPVAEQYGDELCMQSPMVP